MSSSGEDGLPRHPHATPHPLTTVPRSLDIVLCRFPFLEEPETPPPRRSPCLVWRVRRHLPTRTVWISVFFGTSNLKLDRRTGRDLIIRNAARLRAMGLRRATRFDLEKHAELPWNTLWFPCPDGKKTPIIGRLDDFYTEELKRLLRKRAGRDE